MKSETAGSSVVSGTCTAPAPAESCKETEDCRPAFECIEVEKVGSAYIKSQVRSVRDKRTLFRDRELLSPLIKAHGVETVKKRIAAYFDQPAKYNLRTVPKFCERYNGITATAPPPSDYSDWDDFDTGGDKCTA